MKTWCKIAIIIMAIIAYAVIGVTSTDEAKMDMIKYDRIHQSLRQQYGETGGDIVFYGKQ